MATTFTPEQIAQILEEFFNTVGTRQYIGARYVPIFGRKDEESIEWDNTDTYEPLTIVLYQGNSYTSRQYVPVGVEIDNQEFWAITGNYNAQVEQYRRETTAAKAAADAAQEAADAAQGSADTAQRTADGAQLAADAAQQAADTAQTDIDTLLPKADFDSVNTVSKAISDAKNELKEYVYKNAAGSSSASNFYIEDEYAEVYPNNDYSYNLQGSCRSALYYFVSFSINNNGVYIQRIMRSNGTKQLFEYPSLNVVNSLVYKNGYLYGASRHTDAIYRWDANTMQLMESIPLNGNHVNNLCIDNVTGGWLSMNLDESTQSFSFMFFDESFNLTDEVSAPNLFEAGYMTNGIATIGNYICVSNDIMASVMMFNRNGSYSGTINLFKQGGYSENLEIESFDSNGKNLYVYIPVPADLSIVVIMCNPFSGLPRDPSKTFSRDQKTLGAILLLITSLMYNPHDYISSSSVHTYNLYNSARFYNAYFRFQLNLVIKRQFSILQFDKCITNSTIMIDSDDDTVTIAPSFVNCTLANIVKRANSTWNVKPSVEGVSVAVLGNYVDNQNYKTTQVKAKSGCMFFVNYSQNSLAQLGLSYNTFIENSGTSIPLFLYDTTLYH